MVKREIWGKGRGRLAEADMREWKQKGMTKEEIRYKETRGECSARDGRCRKKMEWLMVIGMDVEGDEDHGRRGT